MRLMGLIRFLSIIGLFFASSAAFAHQNVLNITVENKSKAPYTLVIYGSGSAYEIINAFDTLPAQKNATIQINYEPQEDSKTKNTEPTYHILLLNSDTDCCKVEYSAHPSHSSQYHFFKSKKFIAKLKSYEGPCQVWRESADTLHVVLVGKEPVKTELVGS